MPGPSTIVRDLFGFRYPVARARDRIRSYQDAMIAVAIGELGCGELGPDNRLSGRVGNNSGPHVARYKAIVDDGDPDDDGAWCADFLSYVGTEAARRYWGRPCPFHRSSGARRLWRTIAASGRILGPDEDPAPGDFGLYDRGDKAWQAHIVLVARFDPGLRHMYSFEGNTGGFPSYVQVIPHDIDAERARQRGRLEGFCRLPADPWRDGTGAIVMG